MWGGLENPPATGWFHRIDVLGSRKAYSPLQTVQALAEEGYLESDDARRLREMARLRSAVVHGDFAVDVSAEQVEFLLDQLQALKLGFAEVAAEHAGQ